MPLTRLPRKFLTAWTVSPDGCSRSHGRRILTTRYTFLDSLRHIGIKSDDGNLKDLIHLSQDLTYDTRWKWEIKQFITVDKLSQVDFLNT